MYNRMYPGSELERQSDSWEESEDLKPQNHRQLLRDDINEFEWVYTIKVH